MKIEITTSAKNFEMANYVLGRAIAELRDNPDKLDLTPKDVDAAAKFRKAMLKAFFAEANR